MALPAAGPHWRITNDCDPEAEAVKLGLSLKEAELVMDGVGLTGEGDVEGEGGVVGESEGVGDADGLGEKLIQHEPYTPWHTPGLQ